MADVFDPQRANDPTSFGKRLTAWTVGATDIPGGVKGVCFNADGTADVTNDDGTTEAGVPVTKMVPMVIIPKKVTAMATATKCYLIR